MKKIQNINVRKKNVLVRVDFNVEIQDGKAKENFKIAAGKETVQYLIKNNAKIALISHLGRPEGRINPEFSIGQIIEEVEKLLEVRIKFISDCIGKKVEDSLKKISEREVLLLENVRFYPGEESNDEEFSRQLAKGFDIFINDAFSVCHRDQASVTGVAKILPNAAGFWLQKEIDNLDRVKNNPEYPAVAIIGGAKIETKLPLIKEFEKKYNYVLVGGKIANEALDQGIKFSEKVVLPTDFAGDRLDIGYRTIEKFKEKIDGAKTIVWNGPLGKFEDERYANGTREILKTVVESDAFVLMGGGESVQLLEETVNMGKISFVSTGGGAMLEYLSGNSMPGLDALK